MIRVSDIRFDPAAELAAFQTAASDAGAVVSFTGRVRDDGATEALILSHYAGFTEAQIETFVAEARKRWGLQACTILHRVGEMVVGEPIVFVATASAHRRDAFEACDFLMDKLKSEAPFWKQENKAGKRVWIEPREQDKVGLKRWDDARS
ncbi:molybdenum cofactor biosynthesis protein MoaE [Litorimonas cladophorae]|uniref:Molybdopterin synthase catalytic subunit n=1 Tax=Litorimonas cladophorae TaxID=1220491 RepID=A0A918NCP3_9PROT|nr:molybdenum cofactor biosynthesis protein MoaE [Litorimonas cladophorae]GGX62739.1 molybdenum cofactor biosynthesis protein MoaE [Litorimonas cladophorae]